MILDLNCDEKVDGTEVRASIITNEVNLISSIQDIKDLDGLRRNLGNRVKDFKSILDSNENKSDIIERLSQNINVDIFGGMFETMEGLYTFAKREKLSADKVGMSKNDYEAFIKSCNNISSLYGSWSKLSNQLYGKKITNQKNQLNVDATMTDSDGKSVNIMTTLAEEESDLTSETNTTIKNNFKVYLNFLYNALVAVKNSKAVEDSVYRFLLYMWYEDTRESLEHPNINKRVLPIIASGVDLGVEAEHILLVDKSKRKTVLDDSSIVYAKLKSCIASSCKRSYIQYRSILSDAQNSGIGRDRFVFTRYIFKMYSTIEGFKVFEPGKVYNYDELENAILNLDNPNALCNRIPAAKYLPEFFNRVNTVKEWYETPVDAFSKDYNLETYLGDSKTKIHIPAFDILNSSSITRYPQTLQSSAGSVLNYEQEKKQILQLCHLTKLLGTAVGASNLYSSLFEEKYNRVILLEPQVTLNAFKNSNKESVSLSASIDKEINRSTNAILYKITPTDARLFDISYATYSEPEYIVTSEATKGYIDSIITNRAKEIADFYLDYYYANGWNFPFITRKETLLEKIQQTKKSEIVISNLSIMRLLGDFIPVKVYLIDNNGEVLEDKAPMEGVLTGDYKVGISRSIFVPRLVQKPAKNKNEYTYVLGIKTGNKEEE